MRKALIAVGLAVTVFFTYLAVRDIDWDETWRALREANLVWLVPAFAAFAGAIVVRAFRWRALFARERRPPFEPVMRAVLVGYFFSSVLPARAGEAARIVELRRRAGVSAAESFATIVVERTYDVLTLLLFFLIAYPFLPEVGWFKPAAVLVGFLLVGLGTAVVVLAVYGERPIHAVLRPLHRFVAVERLESAGASIAEGLAGVRRAHVAVEGLAWTLFSWVALSLSNWLLMLGFDFEISFVSGLLVSVATGVALILPAAPSGIGVYEAATIAALAAYDVPKEEALSYALVLHALNFVPFLIAGPIALGGFRLRFSAGEPGGEQQVR
jgi:glycosyltransferase 2 family protein